MMFVAAVTMAGCLAVGANSVQIVAGEMAPAYPALSALPVDTPVAFAPAPGVTRIFHLPELRMLAARFHLEDPPPEICVECPVFPLQPGRLLEAMRQTLPDGRIEILDYSRQPAPQGEIQFPLAGLRSVSSGEIWTGSVTYAPGRRFTVWAKVQVRVRVRHILAIGDLPPGRPISSGQVLPVDREEFPTAAVFAGTVDEVIGKWPRLLIPAGAAIRPAQLDTPKAVARGDRVVVEVHDGGASLRLDAVAQASGAAGETILVRNPDSQRCFRARVEGEGRVSVAGPFKRNP